MIEDIAPEIYAPLNIYQIMQFCYEGDDWRRVFQGLKKDKFVWQTAHKLYIASRAWQKKRIARLMLDAHRCTRCPSVHILQVHHLNYDSIGDEDVEKDLITLCIDCHKAEHGIGEVPQVRGHRFDDRPNHRAADTMKKV